MEAPISYKIFLFSSSAPSLIFGDFNNQISLPKLYLASFTIFPAFFQLG